MGDVSISEEEFRRLKAAAGEPIPERPKPCAEAAHVWTSIGGINGGCHEDCCCSVPAMRCVICGADDYGENDEARSHIESCLHRLEFEAEDADAKDRADYDFDRYSAI